VPQLNIAMSLSQIDRNLRYDEAVSEDAAKCSQKHPKDSSL
jgi:hypothetical protein